MDDSENMPPPPMERQQSAPPRVRTSRLPIPRKVSGTLSNQTANSLRSQSSRESVGSSVQSARTNPTLTTRASFSRLPNVSDQGDRNFTDATASSAAKAMPRKMASNTSLNGNGTNGPTPTPPPTNTLKGKVSSTSLQARPAGINTSIARKASGSLASTPTQSPQLQAPRISLTPKGRRTSDINGAAAPPLNRRPSNTQLKQPATVSKRQSMSQLTSKNLATLGASNDASPTPLRRQPVVGFTAPRTPTATRTVKPPQTGPRQLRAPKASGSADAAKKIDPKKTSQSLRDTIRQARMAKQVVPNGDASNGLDGFDFGTADPFGQSIFGEGGSTKVLQQRIKSARVEGRLNISNMQLKEIPVEVYKMYETTEDDLADTDDDGPKWYENVDLAKMIGADNEITEISEELAMQFAGLSVIDLHNNLLTTMPANLAQLTELTVLNLAGNNLGNEALDIIFQISALKDLKLSKNSLEGELDASVSGLMALESMELHDNKLTALPSSIGRCSHLRVLNIARNAIAELPMEELQHCPLTELDVSQNKLSDVFFPTSVERWDSIQSLNVGSNHITSIAISSISLPALTQLFASNNQLSAFPTLSGCAELLVLIIDQNRITTLPDDLYNLRRLRTLDFSGNNVKAIDPRLGAMESLEVINFAGNPLSDRKLAGMCPADLKKTLRGRLAPPEIVIAEADDDHGFPGMGSGMDGEQERRGSQSEALEIGRGGVLDLTNKGLSELSEELIDNIMGSPYTILLTANSFNAIPTVLDQFASLTVLDLSKNRLSTTYLSQKLVLRSLETLNLHSAGIQSLELLFQNLDSPKLQTLDVSANRISSIEGLRGAFPALYNFHAADNQISEIPIASVDGIRSLDLTGNSIHSLPPRLALCEGLRELRVQGNLFKVPRWQVLEKGTDSVLAWLRDRLPVENGDDDDDDEQD